VALGGTTFSGGAVEGDCGVVGCGAVCASAIEDVTSAAERTMAESGLGMRTPLVLVCFLDARPLSSNAKARAGFLAGDMARVSAHKIEPATIGTRNLLRSPAFRM
jgi:hypothetical protein